MKFLIGIDPHKEELKSLLMKKLKQIDSDNAKITFTNDWISALGYAAIENYSSIWIDWDILKKYYLNFHQKLYKLKKDIPLIILTNKAKIDYQICTTNDLLFSFILTSELSNSIESHIELIKSFRKLYSETPPDVRKSLRPNGLGPFIGNSPEMLEIYRQIIKVANTDFTVLVSGGSGSGKELVAKTIHNLSSRKTHQFVSLNCAAIPENLLESELFGYEKGAFTGANESKPGKFELAHKGTIFLDEIGDMPSNLQAKLLRVLEDHIVERLGGTKSKRVDIRLIAATNQDLDELISKRKFRSDLHYRLNVIPIHLPPLNRRGKDILLLTLNIVGNLMNRNPGITQSIDWSLIKGLQKLDLAGNVRELENIITRIIFHSDGPVLTNKVLKQVMARAGKKLQMEQETTFERGIEPLWYVEKVAIQNALIVLEGNISKVATHLGISRTALYQKMGKYQITKS